MFSNSPWIRSDERLTLETSAFESLYGGQFTLSTQLIKPNYLVILPPTQHHSFFRNLPPLSLGWFRLAKSKADYQHHLCGFSHCHKCSFLSLVRCRYAFEIKKKKTELPKQCERLVSSTQALHF